MIEIPVNTKEPGAVNGILDKIVTALNQKPGRKIITIKNEIRSGNGAQRRYYHAEPVNRYMEFEREQGNMYTHDQCHDDLKFRFRRRVPVPDLLTGEIVREREQLGGEMSTEDWSIYIEAVIVFLTRDVGLIIRPPSHFYDEPVKGAA